MDILKKLIITAILSVFILPLKIYANEFRYSSMGDVNTLDPHAFDETMQLGYLGNIYDPLISRNNKLMQMEPALAVKWEMINKNTWRFYLRKNVKFHNGNKFNADDVVFSMERAAKSQVGYRVKGVSKFVAVDEYTVDMISESSMPFLINNFFYLYIMDKEWCIENNTSDPGGVDSKGEAYADLNTNGTGAFKVIERTPNVKTVAVPNNDWWGEKRHNVSKAVFRPINSDSTRLAALLSGELEMMYPVPMQDIKRVKQSNDLDVLTGAENRSIFLGLDVGRDELLYSNIKGKNPFKDQRVRKAFYQAINIDAIIRTVMRGQAVPAKSAGLSPSVSGYLHDIERHPYDINAAKSLLNEAGYPDGFDVTLDCPNDRYVNDEEVCQALVSMLGKININVTLNAQTKSKHFGQIGPGGGYNSSFALVGFGPGNFDGSSIQALLLNCRTKETGTWNFSNHCNPLLDEMYKILVSETNSIIRDPIQEMVWTYMHKEIPYIPLHLQTLAWGVKNGVKLMIRADNVVSLNEVVVN